MFKKNILHVLCGAVHRQGFWSILKDAVEERNSIVKIPNHLDRVNK